MEKDFLIIEYDELDSTQTEAKNLLYRGKAYPNTVVFTASQTKGRAKNIRTWSSAQGDLACTIILKPSTDVALHPQITYIAAIAVSNAIRKFFPAASLLHKWVNDVLLENRKVSGILLEKYQDGFILVGIGINILPKKPIPDLNAIGITDISPFTITPKALLQVVLEEFFELFVYWEQFGFQRIKIQWLARAANLNKKIVIKIEDQEKSGIFLGIDDKGNLQLLRNQKIELLCAGDVFYKKEYIC
ncbi:MAG: biotin--[acetyl-CoA-carboxylase] ligase [Candidatus Midichloria sp.]|uniref:Biotin--[acetyl-CoA-carboxylase] ligase n=1 Tax=Hyalomma marginatum TaxID=34627 RepID=A0A8S4C1W1_9ACAR|nr:biotin--[acetyl-CoA-carboxylase] ligase [Hyalomma marginatum]CAG7593821.1 biotin--[acetyl-CoA-carboxylase] ligase [Hyalomma marginatum]